MTYLLGIDVGTSALKAALFTPDGRAAAQASRGYATRHPQPGWAEQDPADWWAAACAATREALDAAGARPGEVACVGVDGQSWAAVAVDAQGEALLPTPIWTDTRAREECAQLERLAGAEALFACSGNPLGPGYTLPKIRWYQRHAPQAMARAAAVLQSNGYIVRRLTGECTQDASQGYGLACFDVRRGRWDLDLARALQVPAQLLAPVRACHEVVGRVTAQAAALTGLLAGTPVVAGGLDAACGALGAGVTEPGQTQEQGGQAGGMSICLDAPVADPRLILSQHVAPGRWLLQGGTTGGGGALKWLREQVCPELSFEQMSELAAGVPAGSGGVLFLPYMEGERSPLWNPDARGAFYGLRYGVGRAHLVRAMMEGVAFSLRHNLDVAAAAGARAGTLRAMGGAANSRVWTQIKADVTGRAIEVPGSDTATALGAAMLAGMGAGVYADAAEAARTVRVTRTHRPDAAACAAYEARYAAYLELSQRLQPMMRETKE